MKMAALLSKKIIKPSSATPESHHVYNLSSIDQACPTDYVPVAFFYPFVCGRFGSRSQISKNFEDSLSKVLVYYYPFAGRVVGNHHVSCNDAGVELREVQINRPMSEILSNTHCFAEEVVFPSGLPWTGIENGGDNLVVIQLNYFNCGGLAIAACMSHKIADAASIILFMNDLAATYRESNYKPSPEFLANTVFPPLDNSISFESGLSLTNPGVTRRFVFQPAELEKLKAMAAESGIEKPTRVEVVNALLIQRARAASTVDCSSLRPLLLMQPTNVRPCIQLKHNSIGSIAPNNIIVVEDGRVNFQELVSHLRNGKVKFQNVFKQKTFSRTPLQDAMREVTTKLTTDRSYEFFMISSLCGYPVYEVDFGWGKPTRVCLSEFRSKGGIYLIDTPDNGVEAMFNLEEQQMSKLEQDKEVLPFICLKPAY